MNQNRTTDYLFFAIAAGIVLMTIGLIIGEARGQGCYIDPSTGRQICPTGPRQPSAPVQHQPKWSDCLVRVDDGDGVFSSGSGTPIGRHPERGGTIILTNNHVVADRKSDTSVTVTCQGKTAQGTVLDANADMDVAAVWIAERWQHVEIADSVDDSAAFQTRGWAGGRTFKVYGGRIRHRIRLGYFISNPVYSGMSGGGVFQGGKYVGILWGGDPNYTAIHTVTHIRPFLDRILGSRRIDVIVEEKPRPTPATPRLPDQTMPPEDCGCRDRFSKIDKLHAEMLQRLNSLEANAGKVSELVVDLDQSIDQRIDVRVDQKIAEIKFPECPKPDTSGLELRINTLESQLAEMKRNTPVSWDIVPKE